MYRVFAQSDSNQPPGAEITRFPPKKRTDASLVAGAAAGDREAIGAIWDRYSSFVRSVIYGAFGPDHAVEDLVQEVFIALIRGADRIQNGTALRGYLATVAVRQVAQEIRRRKVRRIVGLSPTGELPEQTSPPIDSEHRDALAALHRVLDRMSTRRRMAFILRHVQGLEMLEIAGALRISESTLRRELTAARDFIDGACKSEPSLAAYLSRYQGTRS